MLKKTIKKLLYPVEAALLIGFYYFFKMLPIDLASTISGKIVTLIGMRLKATKTAYKNLSMCFPQLSDGEKKKIVLKMWDNLGRIFGEMPHNVSVLRGQGLKRRVKMQKGIEKLEKRAIFLSAHFGNFEMGSAVAARAGYKTNLVYRIANNKLVDKFISNARLTHAHRLIAKGTIGVKKMIMALESEEVLCMLVDQKMNTGESLKLFGFEAKTTNLPAKLALKYDVPIYMMRLQRREGAYFEMKFDKVEFSKTDDPNVVMQRINDVIESWVREAPEQWFWVHKRWDFQ